MANKLIKVCQELFPDAGICGGYLAAVETTDPFKMYCRIELYFSSSELAKTFYNNNNSCNYGNIPN